MRMGLLRGLGGTAEADMDRNGDVSFVLSTTVDKAS